ncbi:hypothetical protein ATCVGM07011_920L [Acanthocystis turfacea Chlorella virus GM0701.1]|nr:hypothetical protein ATCVGM07011_920L [Acanthocystis turfacea Chlorella virus GM0701.1]AGE59926.1 hypothetical protein ATCVTN60342_944L [Acanthocystis turfacea Chlorella virus TN603.4.2]
MNYLATFFWVVALVLISMSVAHFVKIMKTDQTKRSSMDIVKAVVYISGAVLIAVVLIYKPFDTSMLKIGKVAKAFRPQATSSQTVATIITTSLSSPGVSV